LGEGWGNADCLKSKAELPIKGGLAFLLGESVLISVRYLKLCEFFDIGKISPPQHPRAPTLLITAI
jgi:hypothetical protein